MMICYHRHVAKEFRLRPLAFSIEKNYTLKCFNCSTNSYSFEESIRALLHSTPSVKEEEHKILLDDYKVRPELNKHKNI